VKDLHITVKNKIATFQSRDGDIVCGNNDYQVIFTFDAEWDDYSTKTARFIWNGQYTDVVFTGTTVTVPIIMNTTLCTVGVYAGDLRTTTPAFIGCRKSILCPNPVHVDPTPDVYDQIMAAINNGTIKGEKGDKGDSGNPSGNILQTTGQSAEDTMSQKAITTALNAKEETCYLHVIRISGSGNFGVIKVQITGISTSATPATSLSGVADCTGGWNASIARMCTGVRASNAVHSYLIARTTVDGETVGLVYFYDTTDTVAMYYESTLTITDTVSQLS